jgi:hypothetical protein
MAFLLRLLMLLSLLTVLGGVLIKINHWNYDYRIFMNSGIAGIAIYFIGSFTVGERTRIKGKK